MEESWKNARFLEEIYLRHTRRLKKKSAAAQAGTMWKRDAKRLARPKGVCGKPGGECGKLCERAAKKALGRLYEGLKAILMTKKAA